MSKIHLIEPTQRTWITSKIGWLSVCIIAAAWGNQLLPGSYWGNVWGMIGVFGLASALGLASIAAARQRKAESGANG
jgi:di/tricarboxylate transporter